MVAWFVIGLSTLTLFAFLAINTASNVSASYDTSGRAETARRIDAAINALLTSSASPNGTTLVYLPTGVVSNGVYTLPASLAQYAVNGNGQPLIYCPFGGSESGTNLTIPSNDGSNYTVQTASLNGVSYVVGGRPNYAQVSTNANLMGFIMSPRGRADPSPSCDSVTYNATSNTFAIPNGIVRPIIRYTGPEAYHELSTKAVTWYVSPTGTGTGTVAGDPSSLTTALDFWRSRQPSAMTITFANGNYTMPAGYMDVTSGAFADQGHNTSLTLSGSIGNVFVTQSASGNVTIPKGSITVSGINFDANTNFVANAAATVTLNNASAGAVVATQGGIANINASTLTSATAPVASSTNGAIITFTGSDQLIGNGANAIVYAQNNAQIVFSNAAVTASVNGGSGQQFAYVGNASSLTSIGSTVALASNFTSAFAVYGGVLNASNLTVTNSATLTDFIDATNGAQVTLNGGGIAGNRPTNIGFNDYGASYIGGGSFGISGNASCWGYNNLTYASKGVLSQSAAPTNGANTSVLADSAVGSLSSNTPAAVQAYSNAVSANAIRDSLRSANQSAWVCSH